MDFLLLVPNRQGVVEVDGRQHHTDNDGRANTAR
jgi:very-short-patch-repair endonuclease